MIIKNLLRKIKITNSQVHIYRPAQTSVLFKLFKKKFMDKQQKYKPQPETYSTSQAEKPKKNEQEKEDLHAQPQYDFFSRQKQIQLSQDYRKARQQIQYIPQEVGKGGFDQVVYWSQFAKTPQQIVDLIKVFNRIKMPEQISDKFRFQQFGNIVMKTVYLSSNLNILQEFATFGQRFSLKQPLFWKKIEEKAVRMSPKTSQEIKDCIEIAFIMSKVGQGQIIYSSLCHIFKNMVLSPQDTAKLLIVYSNTQSGDKIWVEKLLVKLIQDFHLIRKQIVVELFTVFQKSKLVSSQQQKIIMQRIENLIPQFQFKELCLASGFVGHNKMPKNFWTSVEKRAEQLIPDKKNTKNSLYLLQLISSYSLSLEFIRKHFLSSLRQQNYKVLRELPPQFLSIISKTLYIYQLQNETKDIQQLIQLQIITIYQNLKNVQVQNLIKVIKDYTVTRIGSRSLYVFLEQVADAMFEQIKLNREQLSMLCSIYEKSQLCSAQFLEKITTHL